jgi:class 3 adenylate cyclase
MSAAQIPPNQRLQSLLPWRLLERLGTGAQSVIARTLDGAVLFADISGYTRIAARLCEAGDEGLGHLSALLNDEFSRYLDVVAAHGGEVISIAGDALSACFLAADQSALDRARRCARALASLSDRATDPAYRVALHLGVAPGSIWLARTGGWFQRWELLVGGPALRGACGAAARARPGEVVVIAPERASSDPAPDAGGVPLAEVADSGAPAETDGDWWWGLLPPQLLDDARHERLGTSELRQVNVLFVRVHGLDEGRPRAIDEYQRVVLALHQSIGTGSAASGRLLIDGGGLVFVLVLGDSRHAHGDDPERAVAFGLGLRRRLSALGLRASMGFASGRVFCGVIGNDVRRQYVTIGPTMNLAARLMDSSADGLVAALPLPTHRLARHRLVAGETLSLKGFSEPVATVVVSDPEGSEAPAERIQGRDREIAALSDLLAAAASGRGGIGWIFGEAGMGKSSLIRQVRAQAADLGLRCLVGEAELAERSTSYFAWRSVVRGLLDATPDDDADELRRKLIARLAALGRAEGFAPLFNVLLPLHLPDTPVTAQLRGPARAEVLGDLLVDLIRRESVQPLVIVIEDVHWLDSASAFLIDQVVSRLDRPLLLLTARPGGEETTLAKPLSHPPLLRFDLSPLAVDSVADLLALTCGGPVDGAVVSLVHEQTGGNPFFAQEYLLQLRDGGHLALGAGRWRLVSSSGEAGQTAPTLRGIIASRIDALSADGQRTLKTAAVLGQQVDLSLLRAVAPELSGDTLTSVLGDLVRQRFFVSDGDPAQSALRFSHALVRSAAYDLMLFQTRTDLHRSVAEAIERRSPHGLGGHSLLVHHWSRARNETKTAEHAERAADEAVQQGTFPEAKAFMDLCLTHAERDPSFAGPARRARWQITLAEAASGLGDLNRRRSHAEAALTLSGYRVPKTAVGATAAALVRLTGRAIRRLLGGARFVAPLAGTSASNADRISHAELARANRQLSVVSYFANEPFRILYFAATALAHAERVGPCPDLCGALAELGAWFGLAGAPRLAGRYLTDALQISDALADAPTAAHVRQVQSLYSVGCGDWATVRAAVERCQQLCVELGDRVQWANAQIVRFWLHHYVGETVEAETAARGLQDAARESGNRQHQTWALRSLAHCSLERGAFREALTSLEESLAILGHGADRNELLPTQGSLAMAHLHAGNQDRAQEVAGEVLRQIRSLGRPMGHATLEGWSGMTAVVMQSLRAEPRSGPLQTQARAAVRHLRRQAAVFPIAIPRYRYWQGQLRLLEGRDPTPALKRGLEVARLLGMNPEIRRLEAALASP